MQSTPLHRILFLCIALLCQIFFLLMFIYLCFNPNAGVTLYAFLVFAIFALTIYALVSDMLEVEELHGQLLDLLDTIREVTAEGNEG